MKPNIHILSYAILILFIIFQFLRSPKPVVIDNSRMYELKIDSIRNSILDRIGIIDSLESVISANDVQIGVLEKNIIKLNRERNENKLAQKERDREIANMSGDSLVLFVRDQLMLWSAAD